MECDDCVRRLDQLIDRELSGLELEEVHHHLDGCGDCTKRYKFEEGLKRLVKVSCEQGHAPAELRERLRQILR